MNKCGRVRIKRFHLRLNDDDDTDHHHLSIVIQIMTIILFNNKKIDHYNYGSLFVFWFINERQQQN